MRTITIIFLLVLFLNAESSEPKLECTNNFDTEMVCHLTSPHLSNCLEYSLNMSREPLNMLQELELFICSFKEIYTSKCECTLHVFSSFVIGEKYKCILLRGKNIMSTTYIYTTATIKPTRPVIVSVKQTNKTNFIITWSTNYTIPFTENLITELTYGIKGSKQEPIELEKGQTEYELVGRNLQSNANYIVKARVKSDFSDIFSDYSEPFEFTTPSSTMSILEILIPVLCVIMIICISAIYFCYSKIQKEWWDKIPNPQIPTHFVKQVPQLLSFQNEFSPIHLDLAIMEYIGQKTWIASSQADDISQNSHHTLSQEGNSAQVIYAQTGYESIEGNSSENNLQCELLEEYQSANPQQMSMSNNVQSNTENLTIQKMCMGNSGIDNLTYLKDIQSKSVSHLTSNLNQSEIFFADLSKNLNPVIRTDFESGCATQFTPSSNETAVVPEYQSVSEVMDSGNKLKANASMGQAFIRSQNDVNINMQKVNFNRNPHDIIRVGSKTIIPAENEYQDFQSLCKKPGEQVDRSTSNDVFNCESHDGLGEDKLLLNRLCDPALHISTPIQIDCSYHRV